MKLEKNSSHVNHQCCKVREKKAPFVNKMQRLDKYLNKNGQNTTIHNSDIHKCIKTVSKLKRPGITPK